MKIIKNIKTLNSLQKKYNFTYDKEYKYILKNKKNIMYNYEKEYKIKYLGGCFYPYIIKTDRKKLKSLAQLYYDNVDYYDIKYLKNNDFVVVLNKELTKNEIDFLNHKYYNLDFNYNIKSEYAPENIKKCIYVKNKMEV